MTGVARKSSDRELRMQLMQLTQGYWRSQVLFAATELGVFAALAGGELPGAEVAARCAIAEEPAERLCNAAVALGLLEKSGDRYRNARLAELFLVEGAAEGMSQWVRFMADIYEPWGSLAGAVRAGRPVVDGFGQLFAGRDYTRHIILAMHEYARGPGREIVHHVDLTGRTRLLDVGGGPGTHSILFAQRYPDLHAEVLDLPPVLEITREIIAEYGMTDRVSTRAGNYHTDDLGSGYDVVVLSNMLHQEDPETCMQLLRKAHAALTDGGLLVVQLAFLNADKTSPAWAALQSLQLLLMYPGGRAYSFDEVHAMLPEAGFTNAKTKKMSMLSSESLIVATRAPAVTHSGSPSSAPHSRKGTGP